MGRHMSRGWVVVTVGAAIIAALVVLYSLGLLGNAAIP